MRTSMYDGDQQSARAGWRVGAREERHAMGADSQGARDVCVLGARGASGHAAASGRREWAPTPRTVSRGRDARRRAERATSRFGVGSI
jgi:hypothetical protein